MLIKNKLAEIQEQYLIEDEALKKISEVVYKHCFSMLYEFHSPKLRYVELVKNDFVSDAKENGINL